MTQDHPETPRTAAGRALLNRTSPDFREGMLATILAIEGSLLAELRAAVEALRDRSEPREFGVFSGALDRRDGWNGALDKVAALLAGDKAEAPLDE